MGFLQEICRNGISIYKKLFSLSFSSLQSLSCVQLLRLHGLHHARPPCPSPTPRVHSNSGPSSWWCHPAISSSIVPFSCPRSLPATESFPMSQLFAWSGQNTGVSALASFLPKNTQDWSPLGWTGWISLQSKGLSRVFSNTTFQKHQFWIQFSSLQSLSHVWLYATPWIAAHQASLSITNSQSSLKLRSSKSVMPSSHLILCHPLLLPPIPLSIRVFSNESTLHMK